ncbi:sugar phosphate isomerase/epimerase family protein [Photobacterium sp. DNB23_23_1]
MNMRDRLTINTAIFDGHDLDESLGVIKSLGVKNVELALNQGYVGTIDDYMFSDEHAIELKEKFEKHELNSFALGCTMDLASDDAINQFNKRIAFANKLGITYLNTCTTKKYKRELLVNNLKILVENAEKNDCIICLENGGDSNFDAFSTLSDGIDIINEVGSDFLALNFDPGNTKSLLPEIDPVEQAISSLPYCKHFHVKDVIYKNEEYNFPAIGKGIIDYSKIISEIKNGNLYFSLEIPLRMHRDSKANAIRSPELVEIGRIRETLEESINYINAI